MCHPRHRAPHPPAGTLASLGDAHGWIGLKSKNDEQARFDVRVQVLKNATLLSEGVIRCVQDLSRNPAAATPVTIPFGPFSPVVLSGTDDLSLRVSTRRGTNPNGSPCGGSLTSAGLRLFFDSIKQPSSFTAGLTP
ncbi:MAG: hypothetical protein ABI968_12065 [Acidobacteriota bacterium]